jgi:hypothetical protein
MWLDAQNAAQAVAQDALKDDLVKGLAGGVLGLVGTIATVVVGSLKDRDITTKRAQQLDEATKRLAFWEAWLKVVGLLDFEQEGVAWKEQAKGEILSASNAVQLLFKPLAAAKVKEGEAEAPHALSMPKWRRWLLLYWPPKGKGVRSFVPRVLFYIYAITGVAYVPEMALFSSYLPAVPRPFTGRDLVVDLSVAVTSLVFAWLFRLWAVHIEEPKPAP